MIVEHMDGKNESCLFLFKAIRDTRLLRKGQKCWSRYGTTGACAARTLTKYRGKGRWINVWVHWADDNGKAFPGHGAPDVKWIGKVEVGKEFVEGFERLGGL